MSTDKQRAFDPETLPQLFGHPTGLYTLFFAEMWERFSYYGDTRLLILYMIKGFLGFGDKDANAVYGAYTALVYMTPFFGGMIADKLLGSRTSVVIGGLLMAAGQLMLTAKNDLFFLYRSWFADCRKWILQTQHLHDCWHTLSSWKSQARRWFHDIFSVGSTSAPRWPHCCAVTSVKRMAGNMDSGWRPWGCS